jgi:L-threonylcarbamoyladenylate synthase
VAVSGPTPAEAFEACVAGGGVAVFPADTVYGLACAPDADAAIARLYALKGRAPDKPAATMFFSVAAAAPVLDRLGPRTAAVVPRLLPGPVTLLLPSPSGDPGSRLGLRVPIVPLLAGVRTPVLQTSANRSGEPDAHTLAEVPESIREGADLVLDGGELPGISSTVIDLGRYEEAGAWTIVREGAVAADTVRAILG